MITQNTEIVILLPIPGNILRPTRVSRGVRHLGVLNVKSPAVVEDLNIGGFLVDRSPVPIPVDDWQRIPRRRTVQRYRLVDDNFRVRYDV